MSHYYQIWQENRKEIKEYESRLPNLGINFERNQRT